MLRTRHRVDGVPASPRAPTDAGGEARGQIQKNSMSKSKLLAAAVVFAACIQPVLAQPGSSPAPASGAASAPGPALAQASRNAAYSIDDLIALARRDNHALQAVRAQSLAARAGIASSRAYPNPEIEFLAGPVRSLAAGGPSGSGNAMQFTQRLENPALRTARTGAAEAGARGAEIGVRAAENNMIAAIKTQFFGMLRRQEELAAAEEDLALTQQIRDRIAVRVRTGEGARFDLLRAENEMAIAAKEVDRARAGVAQARALLRGVVGSPLPDGYAINGDFYKSLPLADYNTLRDLAVTTNPEIRRAAADVARAERQVDVERQSVMPSLHVRLTQDNNPDTRSTRAGIALTVPLWDRRSGPIDEARAQLLRNRSESDSRRFEQAQAFDAAWQQFQAASTTVRALEGGILQQARSLVDIAEAAYRYGERGILEYLDARRQFRVTRNDLIAARFELYAAKTDLERLAARDLQGVAE